ncbi:flagellin lysine-N-methylase [Paenibacillus sp. CF384]|uniref:flagellin lysine-N-methylase n=1 Tax=Paenibacillus sp. CF384 TaxID=1884382 RepID=UPI00089504D7|nr:flagellin lysine-N-methylase [Paenibacillus sp. CF384]SDW61416.1 lysine-N-methylase [Paenibacillus sp. CF384]
MRTLIPDYYEKFKCIGSECEDTCCAGWGIQIDQQTMNKYKHVPRHKLDLKSGIDATKFKMNQGSCHFLTSEKLCQIQLTLGETYLTKTCDQYPRKLNAVDGVKEASATLSCPEVARLVLFNPDGIEIKYVENDSGGSVESRFSSDDHFNAVRDLVLGILQDRRYTIDDRMVILAMYFNDLDNYRGLEQALLSEDFRGVLRDLNVNLNSQFQIVKSILHILKDESKEAPRYKSCLSAVERYYGDSDARYKESYDQYYQPFMEQNEFIMENFLVNYAYRAVDFSKSIEPFFLMSVFYAMLKYHLIGMAGANERLSNELVIDTVQPFMKRFEHHPGTSMIIAFFEKNGFFCLSDFIVLLKTQITD